MPTTASRPQQLEPLHWPLCMDARMIDNGTSGVANYASTLHKTLTRYGLSPLLLSDGGAQAKRARWSKWAAAMKSGPRRLSLHSEQFAAPDIFAEAWVHFNIFHRLLELDAPGAPGVMHWTYPVPLYIRGWHNIYTVHDAIPLIRPDLTVISERRHRRLLTRVIERSDHIITASEAARHDIAQAMGCSPDHITNIYAVDVADRVDGPVPFDLESGHYFIFTGSIEARKNVERLIIAYQQSGSGLPLIIVGSPGLDGARAMSLAASADNVRHLPPQPRPVILNLLRNARALLFPSLAEGFGLPIAEAMTLGVPVMTSRGGATEEIAGGAAFLIDPLDVREMAQAIARLTNDERFCRDLQARGLKQSSAFEMGSYAARLRNLYVHVMTR